MSITDHPEHITALAVLPEWVGPLGLIVPLALAVIGATVIARVFRGD